MAATKDRQQVEFETYGKTAAENKAKSTNAAVERTANTKINKGLGDLIKKTDPAGNAETAIGEPARSSFPPGLVGQSEYNRALTAFRAKKPAPVAAPKSLSGGGR